MSSRKAILACWALPCLLVLADGGTFAQCSGIFKRGDVDGDGDLNISDGIALLGFLFQGGLAPACRDAADSNDSGDLDISDAIHEFSFLFTGGPPPPAPGRNVCGPDPTDDLLDCAEYKPCRPGAGERCETGNCCPEGFYCFREAGCEGGPGVCRERPRACTREFQPVCGCDGRTYGNACEAAAAGVNVAHQGSCEETACGNGRECPPGTYCSTPEGECGGAGVCRPLPPGCPDNVDPVCGCDGRTHGNPCEAEAAGVSILHRGECGKGCRSNGECDPGSYCARARGDCGGAGVCQPRPELCILIFDPVCGCDGRTYGNACQAAAAGVNVASEGECTAR